MRSRHLRRQLSDAAPYAAVALFLCVTAGTAQAGYLRACWEITWRYFFPPDPPPPPPEPKPPPAPTPPEPDRVPRTIPPGTGGPNPMWEPTERKEYR